MHIIELAEAETSLATLVDKALAGDAVVIARSGHPVVRLVPVTAPDGERQPGRLRGIRIPNDAFDPLPDDELAHWE